MTDKAKPPKGVSETGTAFTPAGRTLKVRRIGNSLGVVLPKEILAKLKVGEGDEVNVVEAGDGVVVTAADAETAHLMRLAEEIMRKRRRVLKTLAQ